ncbi:hypothetical protein [Aeromonas simiae]|uniref:hypothetical protein n=1 Tax=Aeromonas simiae TaxID=218936 RepID=UPI0005AA7265|nr:hypothetical protein [Aeromonas simiae]MDO2947480.1 hypothetical protein [Aeromonas simiae]MDO2951572.1 hypothetical protein [Aeromonas simiae]MDO2955040.1 hypothetical protein [Aeromonas simiae]
MRLLLLLSPALLLTACASLPGLPGGQSEPPALFTTHINEEGSKRFVFESAPLERRPGLSRSDDEGQLQRPRKSLLETREALQEDRIAGWLTDKQYCREGFIVLSRTSWKVRGECNETATDADRRAFPNRIGGNE